MQRHIKWEENSSRWSINEINKLQLGHRLGKKKKKQNPIVENIVRL